VPRLLQTNLRAVRRGRYYERLELRQTGFDWIVKTHFTLIHQHHERCGSYWFTHRCNPEQRIGLHRLLGGDIRIAHGLEAENAVFGGHKHYGTSQFMAIYEWLKDVDQLSRPYRLRKRASDQSQQRPN
jgi:hypothetical protein